VEFKQATCPPNPKKKGKKQGQLESMRELIMVPTACPKMWNTTTKIIESRLIKKVVTEI